LARKSRQRHRDEEATSEEIKPSAAPDMVQVKQEITVSETVSSTNSMRHYSSSHKVKSEFKEERTLERIEEESLTKNKFSSSFRGEIPDAKTVYEARKRREKMRLIGTNGQIPLDDVQRLKARIVLVRIKIFNEKNSGEIPDAKTVYEARKRREKMRLIGTNGQIPLDDVQRLKDKSIARSRLIREDDNDMSDEETEGGRFYSAKGLAAEEDERRRIEHFDFLAHEEEGK
uniref:MFAP1 domain-containing protein n=1 Tax=Gongylonema pulchrum TaxID=637853 RepID=A0A183E9A2_9BILA